MNMECENYHFGAAKNMIRSVLMSNRDGVPVAYFASDYHEITGEKIPFAEFGFYSSEEFMKAIPDVVSMRLMHGELTYFAVANSETKHLQNLILQQKKTRKKPKKCKRAPVHMQRLAGDACPQATKRLPTLNIHPGFAGSTQAFRAMQSVHKSTSKSTCGPLIEVTTLQSKLKLPGKTQTTASGVSQIDYRSLPSLSVNSVNRTHFCEQRPAYSFDPPVCQPKTSSAIPAGCRRMPMSCVDPLRQHLMLTSGCKSPVSGAMLKSNAIPPACNYMPTSGVYPPVCNLIVTSGSNLTEFNSTVTSTVYPTVCNPLLKSCVNAAVCNPQLKNCGIPALCNPILTSGFAGADGGWITPHTEMSDTEGLIVDPIFHNISSDGVGCSGHSRSNIKQDAVPVSERSTVCDLTDDCEAYRLATNSCVNFCHGTNTFGYHHVGHKKGYKLSPINFQSDGCSVNWPGTSLCCQTPEHSIASTGNMTSSQQQFPIPQNINPGHRLPVLYNPNQAQPSPTPQNISSPHGLPEFGNPIEHQCQGPQIINPGHRVLTVYDPTQDRQYPSSRRPTEGHQSFTENRSQDRHCSGSHALSLNIQLSLCCSGHQDRLPPQQQTFEDWLPHQVPPQENWCSPVCITVNGQRIAPTDTLEDGVGGRRVHTRPACRTSATSSGEPSLAKDVAELHSDFAEFKHRHLATEQTVQRSYMGFYAIVIGYIVGRIMFWTFSSNT